VRKARNLLSRQATDLTQRQRDAGIRRQSGMAAGEDQPQPVVLDALIVPSRGCTRVGVESLGECRQRDVEPGTPAQGVDGFEAASRNEPGPRISRHTILSPLLQGCPKGIVQRILGEVEVAEQAN
jgi:hypothetical protein